MYYAKLYAAAQQILHSCARKKNKQKGRALFGTPQKVIVAGIAVCYNDSK